jgi:hypothetical protein
MHSLPSRRNANRRDSRTGADIRDAPFGEIAMSNLIAKLTHSPSHFVDSLSLPKPSRPSSRISMIESSDVSNVVQDSALLDPWDRAMASPFWKTVTGRVLLVTWSVAGAALFGFATGAVLGAVTAGWTSPLFRDPSLLSEQAMLMGFVGALLGATIGGAGSDPNSRTSASAPVCLH